TVIEREAISRRVDVIAHVNGRDLGAVAADINDRLGDVDFPLEYHAEVRGDYAERAVTETRVLLFTLAAAVGTFLVLQGATTSWRLAGVAFASLPLALAGGVVAAFLVGGPLSIGSVAGFFAVLSIAVRNQIALLTHYDHLEREGGSMRLGVVVRGARDRVAPIVMTALATASIAVVIVILGDLAGLEIVRPMAVVVLGGLVTSTLMNLFVLPPLYLHFAPSVEADPYGVRTTDSATMELESA
ncbi:MAG: efflux RND transporter permease subunit, partial [Chloroflexota bacterium]|nr:efflux RND transporter permease subunit [Chloroflexota bacterium]